MKAKLVITIEFDQIPTLAAVKNEVDNAHGCFLNNVLTTSDGTDLEDDEIHLKDATLTTFEEISVSAMP